VAQADAPVISVFCLVVSRITRKVGVGNGVRTRDFRSHSPPAEFGRFNGGVVNLATKAGGNAVHGAAFEFVRHAALTNRLRRPSHRVSPEPGCRGAWNVASFRSAAGWVLGPEAAGGRNVRRA